MHDVRLTKENFQEKVMSSDKTVLVDFWAPWCGPCRMLSPVLDEIAQELSDKVVVGKVNIDEQRELAAQFQVMSIPTLAVVQNGVVTAMTVGVKPKEHILKLLGESK